MSKTIANLTLPLIAKEIETVLDTYHYHPYRQAFAIPELREQLVTYVLNGVPTCYAVIEEQGELDNQQVIPRPMRERMRLVVIEGIEQLISENADWVDHHIPSDLDAAYAPSSWFG